MYKIRFKEVNETFPQENRKVFQMVEKAISEASVDDIKRTEEGARAYAARDAFQFLQLAMETHDFVPAQRSRTGPARTPKPASRDTASPPHPRYQSTSTSFADAWTTTARSGATR